MRITLLLEPPAGPAVPFAAGPERYQRLVDELGHHAGAKAQIIKDVLRNAPPDSYILFAGSGDLSRSLADCGPRLASRLAPRIVLVDVSWQKALEQLERHRLAAAVDSLRMSEWLARPSSCTGPFGLRYLARPLGTTCVPMPAYRSTHYCLLESKHHHGMPHLLADYLLVYDRDQKPLSAHPLVALTRMLNVLTEENGGKARTTERGEAAPAALIEAVSIRRTIASLKRAREFAHMTLPQVAERAGLDPEQLSLLEGSEYHRATLGTLRAYLLALESSWGWTLADSGSPALPGGQRTQKRAKSTREVTSPIIVSGGGPTTAATDFTKPSALSREGPWVLVERGITVLGHHRIRRREPQRELDQPTSWTRREASHAGV